MEKPNVEGFRLNAAAAESIARLLQLEPSDRPRKVLSEVSINIAVYRRIAEFDQATVTAAKARDRVVKLGHDAKALLAELEALAPYIEVLPHTENTGQAYIPTDSFKDQLAELALVALSAQQVRLRPGRRKDRALNFLVPHLGDLYWHYTGRIPSANWRDDLGVYGGDFLELVKGCMDASGLPHNKRSNQALGKAINRALAGWKQMPK